MSIDVKWWRGARLTIGALALAWLAGCATPFYRAPVEDRSTGLRTSGASTTPTTGANGAIAAALPAEPGKPLPGIENAGKPGYYSVKPGDTLIRIGLESGQNWKDLVKWNNLDNPNVIEVGQVVRVVPPGVDSGMAATRPITGAKVETRPLDVKPGAVAASGATPAPPATVATAPTSLPTVSTATPPPASAPAPAAPPASAAREGDDDINWSWPSAGAVTIPFEEGRAKGLVIGGKAGDPVYAAADGRVVYAGSGLRGYGNLVILKHNNTYLTAYAHNQALLVKEDQAVRRGQKIAEMGSSDAERVQLHFEIRKLGKPIDPAKLLPPR